MAESPVMWFDEIGMADVPRVGGKNASLGELIRTLQSAGVRVPDGFATTAAAYRTFIAANGIDAAMRSRIAAYRSGDATLRATGEAIRELFLASEFPDDIAESIRAHYRTLGERAGLDRLAVAVRSSATAEDLPDASFAGQQETFLNIAGERELLDACRRCYASLFTDRAISYREVKGFDHLEVALSIGVQRMVRSDVGGSGVMFSIDTDIGLSPRRRHQRRLGPRRNRRPGHRQPGQVPRLQAAADRSAAAEASPRSSRRPSAPRPARWSTPAAAARRTRMVGHLGGRAPGLRARRRRDPRSSPAGPSRSKTTTAGRWTWNGPRTARPASSSSSRRGPRRSSRAGPGRTSPSTACWNSGPVLATGSAIGDAIAPARPASSATAADIATLPRRRHPRDRDDRPRLGAHHEAGGRASSPTTAAPPATRRSSAASSASPPSSAPATPRRVLAEGQADHDLLRRGRRRAASTTAPWPSRPKTSTSARCPKRAPQSWSTSPARPRPSSGGGCRPTGVGPRPDGVHHQQPDPRASRWRWSIRNGSPTPAEARRSRSWRGAMRTRRSTSSTRWRWASPRSPRRITRTR